MKDTTEIAVLKRRGLDRHYLRELTDFYHLQMSRYATDSSAHAMAQFFFALGAHEALRRMGGFWR